MEHERDGEINCSWCTWNNCRSEEGSRPQKPQHNQDQLQYSEKSGKPEEDCRHSDLSQKVPVKTGFKKSHDVWSYEQTVYAQPRICPGVWDTQTPLEFWDTNGSTNIGQTTRPYNNQ